MDNVQNCDSYINVSCVALVFVWVKYLFLTRLEYLLICLYVYTLMQSIVKQYGTFVKLQ
jgi:hypothetical protein